MDKKRIYKWRVVGDDPEEINKLLSDPVFNKKIINPYANVGVITTEDMVVQVEIVPKVRYLRQKPEKSGQENRTFELNKDTIDNITKRLKRQKSI